MILWYAFPLLNVQAVDNMASFFFVFQIWLGDLHIIIGFAQDARCNCVQEAVVCGFWWSYSPSPIIMYLPCHLVRKTFLYVCTICPNLLDKIQIDELWVFCFVLFFDFCKMISCKLMSWSITKSDTFENLLERFSTISQISSVQ